ncbi:MAG: nucleotide sugar dehydrogenase [Chloroflexi bacterium]|nr:nucleotide sugar dehydrogenase [Chloroflexota bacterium]
MKLEGKIANKTAQVAVVGLGYVGLPLAIEFAREGFPVLGVDIDARKIDSLNKGVSYIPDVATKDVKALLAKKKFRATCDYDDLQDADVIFICVPTPFDEMKAPDLAPVISATKSIAPRLHEGQLVILQSTTYPGTTEQVCLPILETSGLKAGKDFHLAFSPERIDPGATSSQGWSVKNTPKTLGGLTPRCTELAKALLVHLTPEIFVVSSPSAAEMSKLLENIFRSVNIALVNELALLSERMGIDFWEVIEAAKTKPFGFMAFYPSAGVGGHCLSENEFLFVKNGHGLRGAQVGEYFAELERENPTAARQIGDVTLLEPEGINMLSFDLENPGICFKPLLAFSRRKYQGAMVDITTIDRRQLSVTDGHPLVVWKDGTLQVQRADALQPGDHLIVSTDWIDATANDLVIDLIPHLPSEEIARTRVAPQHKSFKDHREKLVEGLKTLNIDRAKRDEIFRSNQMPLAVYLELEKRGFAPLPHPDLLLRTGRGPAASSMPATITVDKAFARLIGYYLSEGCITADKSLRTRFTFNANEREYIDDVCQIITALGMRYSTHKDRHWNALQIKVSSNLFAHLIRDVLGCGTCSTSMQIPGVIMEAPESIRLSVLAGLLRGDGDVSLEQRMRHYHHAMKQKMFDHHTNVATVGYFSSSPRLFQQTVLLAQGLGFVPTFRKAKPYLRFYGEKQLARLLPLLDGDKSKKLQQYADGRRKRMPTKSFIPHGTFATIKVAEVSQRNGVHTVYSAEIEDTHTFITSYGIVTHNCIPVDPYYLSWKAREYDFYTKFIELAAEINQGMPYHVVKLASDALGRKGKTLKDACVLVLGVAFKRNVDDARNSPAERVIEILLNYGAQVDYHDPYVAKFRVGGNVFRQANNEFKSIPLTRAAIRASDIVIIVTAHSSIDYRLVVNNAPLIVDSANVTKGLGHREKIARVGAPNLVNGNKHD